MARGCSRVLTGVLAHDASEEMRAAGLNAASADKAIDVHNIRLRERALPPAFLTTRSARIVCEMSQES